MKDDRITITPARDRSYSCNCTDPPQSMHWLGSESEVDKSTTIYVCLGCQRQLRLITTSEIDDSFRKEVTNPCKFPERLE